MQIVPYVPIIAEIIGDVFWVPFVYFSIKLVFFKIITGK